MKPPDVRYDDPRDGPTGVCDCKYEMVQDLYMRSAKLVHVECFRCSVKRVVQERTQRRARRLLYVMWGCVLVHTAYVIGEIFRWWG